MKKFLRMISIYLVAVLVLTTVIGCSRRSDKIDLPELPAPRVTVSANGVASWDEVTGAGYYAYKIDGGEEKLTMDCWVTLEDDQSISVKAISIEEGFADSAYSQAVTYKKEAAPTKLATPQVTVNSNGVASWNNIAGASGYAYSINNGAEKQTTGSSVTVSDGDTIKVKALGSGEYADSDYSSEVTYKNGAVQTKLATPQVTIDANGVASWSKIANASGYAYTVNNGAAQQTTGTTVTLGDGDAIRVKAVGNGTTYTDSDYSQSKTYVKDSNGDDYPPIGELTGYYAGITAKSGNALLGQVHDLITTTHTTYTSYDDCKSSSYVSKTDPGPDGGVLEFYTQESIYSFSGTLGTWNREHVWCQSLSSGLWGKSGGGSDMHHIRPSEGGLNSTRGNHKFGNADGGTPAYYRDSNGTNKYLGGYVRGDTFEPLDNVKGDVARIVFYVYTHYNTYANVHGTTNGSKGASNYFGTLKFTNVVTASNEDAAIKILIEWCIKDPVDDIERTRNEEVFKIQRNRNPFIDHPEFAYAIWG